VIRACRRHCVVLPVIALLAGCSEDDPVAPPAAVLSVSVESLTVGPRENEATFAIANAGSGTLTWYVSSSENYARVSPVFGTGEDSITVKAFRAGLVPGSYAAALEVVSSGGRDTVSVTIVVATPVYVLQWGVPGAAAGEFDRPSDVAVDADGDVYVTDTGNQRVQKFSGDGTFIGQWGGAGQGDGQFSQPRGISVDAAGSVYVADYYNYRIQKFTRNGVFVQKWSTNLNYHAPASIDIDANGFVYVTGSNWIQKFAPSGQYLTEWAKTGPDLGQLNSPADVAVNRAGNVYIADTNNHRVQKFDNTGGFLGFWGAMGSGDGQFDLPGGIVVDRRGGDDVYVADTGNNRIQEFSSDGGFLTAWGASGVGNGQFNGARGIAVDSEGNVYVVDSGNNRIQLFR